MYRGDGVENDGAVAWQHLELLLRHDVPEMEQCQLHLSHVYVQVTKRIFVEGGRILWFALSIIKRVINLTFTRTIYSVSLER